MTRLNWDGTPRDVAEVPLDGGGVYEIARDAGVVTIQRAGPRGGLGVVRRLTPEAADAMADALRQYASDARDWRDARGGERRG